MIVSAAIVPLAEWIDSILDVFTILGIFVGGLWTYFLFVQRRQKYPRASVSHDVAHLPIGEGKYLLHVRLTVSNSGEILLSLAHVETWVQQVAPLPPDVQKCITEDQDPVAQGETEVLWPLLASHEQDLPPGKCEIEPGEHQEFPHDFVVDSSVQAVKVYSYLKNHMKRDREIGWDTTTLYELKCSEERSEG